MSIKGPRTKILPFPGRLRAQWTTLLNTTYGTLPPKQKFLALPSSSEEIKWAESMAQWPKLRYYLTAKMMWRRLRIRMILTRRAHCKATKNKKQTIRSFEAERRIWKAGARTVGVPPNTRIALLLNQERALGSSGR